ncbi:hypothetical protein ANACOL_01436 [Anaerotruncus colihominis DSM 17241]|uniref:Uncharacterized protein n=1 Tax=Anaerotruncus colihominis DSM 17241 TaxID=445972 RepID=B0P9G9_9FIRM|nr:hypothetical protein ANACOL_01436 [Anaerotruncus colihominis DSM 17241]
MPNAAPAANPSALKASAVSKTSMFMKHHPVQCSFHTMDSPGFGAKALERRP